MKAPVSPFRKPDAFRACERAALGSCSYTCHSSVQPRCLLCSTSAATTAPRSLWGTAEYLILISFSIIEHHRTTPDPSSRRKLGETMCCRSSSIHCSVVSASTPRIYQRGSRAVTRNGLRPWLPALRRRPIRERISDVAVHRASRTDLSAISVRRVVFMGRSRPIWGWARAVRHRAPPGLPSARLALGCRGGRPWRRQFPDCRSKNGLIPSTAIW